jgi:hypothetical protein
MGHKKALTMRALFVFLWATRPPVTTSTIYCFTMCLFRPKPIHGTGHNFMLCPIAGGKKAKCRSQSIG